MMPQPKMIPVPWRGLWCNSEDYAINIRGHKIVVPEYLLIDGASIPRYLWPITYHPFDAKIIAAALVHDWLYWSHQVPKYEADLIFKELLVLNGVMEGMANMMYNAVALFGEGSWGLKEDEIPLLRLLYYAVKDSPRFDEYWFPLQALRSVNA